MKKQDKPKISPLVDPQHVSDIQDIISALMTIKDKNQLLYIKGYVDGVAGLPTNKPA